MKICPCIDTVFKGVEPEKALRRIRELGYRGFEFWHAEGRDLLQLRRLMDMYGLSLVNFDAQEVPLTQPGQRGAFLEAMALAFEQAEMLGSECITVLSGDDTGEARQLQHRSIVEGLKSVADEAERRGVTIILEASNRRVNRPNNYLTGADEAFGIIDEVGSTHVKMLYDIYHQQISEGDLLSRILPNIGKIGHFHAAGVPRRHELDECEINYDFVLRSIAESSYTRWVGLEYFPKRDAADGLGKLRRYFDI